MSTESEIPTPRALLADRFQLLSRVADDLAHEIKNPLHAMVINLEVLKRRIVAGDADAALGRAHVLDVELRRVNGLVHQLLLLLRPPHNGPQNLDVDETVAEAVRVPEALARVAHRPFRYQPLGVDVRASIRPDALTYALTALTHQAIAATPPDAEISVATEQHDGLVQIRIGSTALDQPHALTAVGVSDEIATGGALAVADAILRETGAHASFQPAQEGRSPAFCVTLTSADRA